MIRLPDPQFKGTLSLEESILKRRTTRVFTAKDLTQEQISQLLWAAQGITEKTNKYRSAPSAGARYPIEMYILTPEGVFHYFPTKNELEKLRSTDIRQKVSAAALGQESIKMAPVTIVISGDPTGITNRYGDKGIRYMYMEAGHIAQNIHLQATALGLSSVPVGAFIDDALKGALDLPDNLRILYLIPVGYAR